MVLRHCQTNHPLSAEETYPFETEGFGPELEVCCLKKSTKEQQKDPPKTHPLLPRGTATKPKKPNMVWHIQLASCEADAVDRRNLPERITDAEELMTHYHEKSRESRIRQLCFIRYDSAQDKLARDCFYHYM